MMTLKRGELEQAQRRMLGSDGFSFMELMVALSLLAVISIFVLQAFIAGMAHAGRSDERAAATTLAIQVMEQVSASVNPYTMVGIAGLPRSSLPLAAPYAGVVNPTSHVFQVAVDISLNGDLTLTTATVRIFRPADATAIGALTTVLDDQ